MFIYRYGMDSRILANFYRCTIESILTGNFTAWYGNTTAQDRRALQRVIKSAQRLITSELPNIHSLYNQRCLRKAKRIVLDPHHPSYTLHPTTIWPQIQVHARPYQPTGDSFFPQAIRLLNAKPP